MVSGVRGKLVAVFVASLLAMGSTQFAWADQSESKAVFSNSSDRISEIVPLAPSTRAGADGLLARRYSMDLEEGCGVRVLGLSDSVMVSFDGALSVEEELSFGERAVRIDASISDGGSITPIRTSASSDAWYGDDIAGPWSVPEGTAVSFRVDCWDGYVLTSLTHNSANCLMNGEYDASTKALAFRATGDARIMATFTASSEGANSLRAVKVEVEGGHGTTSPGPGVYAVEKGKSYPIAFAPEDGYVPYRIWVDGVQSYVAPTLIDWTLPASWRDQTFKVQFALASSDEPSGDDRPGSDVTINIDKLIWVKDVTQLNVYINGALSTVMPEVEYDGDATKPIIVIAPMLSSEQMEALDLPKSTADLGIYQYTLTTIDGERPNVVEVVSFDADGECLATNLFAKFDSRQSAEAFMARVKRDHGSSFLGGSVNDETAYVRVSMERARLTKGEYEDALRDVVDDLNTGPVEGEDYDVAYADNDKPGIATATITGKGDYYGSQTVRFRIVEKEPDESSPDASDANISSTAPLVQAGASVANQASNGSGSKTDLVKTGDVIGYGAGGISALVVIVLLVMVGYRRKKGSTKR